MHQHMLHKAEKWGYIEVSPGRHVELLSDDSTVRTDYFTQSQIEKLIAKAEEDRRAHPNHFNDWPESIRLDVNTGLRCQEMLFLEFADIRLEFRRSSCAEQEASRIQSQEP